MAGVRTAAALHENGIHDVLILEARDRLGGRLLSVNGSLPTVYDMGASWFHDALNNPLLDRSLAKGNVDIFFDDGKHKYVSSEDRSVEDYAFSAGMEEFFSYISWSYSIDLNKPDMSVAELFKEYAARQKKFISRKHAQLIGSATRIWTELWHGLAWDELLAKHAFSSAEDHLGRNAFVTNGYSTVFRNELDILPLSWQKSHILTSTCVSQIDYTDRDTIKVSCSKGDFVCDYLVLTVPQPLLQDASAGTSGHVHWTPPLPPHIAQVLPHIAYSLLGKVVLEFGELFWPKDTHRFMALPKSTGVLLREKILPWDYPALIVNYMAVKKLPALVILTPQPVSAYIESLSDHEKSRIIWDLYKPIIRQISGKEDPPMPRNIVHTLWNNDPFARGSYASSKVGTIDPSIITKAFSAGIEDRIHFAGAETIHGLSNGCAHGAFLSAEREAAKILKDMEKKKPSPKL